jgi:hypothetical protein
MALPYDAIVPNGGPQPRSAARLRAVGATMAFAMLACVALFAGGRSQRSELMISQQSHVGLNRLADHVLKVGSTMSVDAMAKLMQNWSPRAPNKLDELSPQALKLLSENEGAGKDRTEMLSGGYTMLAPGDSRLCDKKDLILDKFDQLLRKLGGEELSLNISLGKMGAEWHAAMSQWLDAESTYRLRIEQAKEAKEGSKFAEQEYEKYRQAAKEAKENYLSGLKKHDIERQELFDERELIKVIMRYIGVLHDVKATEKSIAAGGRDSIKDSETGVSDTYGEAGKDYKAQTVAALKEKIAHLSELVQKNKTPGAAFSTQKLALLKAHTSKLAVYAETIEVANILKEMLDDIKTRREIIDKVDSEAKKLLADCTAKMVEWEGKLVALGNAKDKAKALMDSAKLEREKLNGDNHVIEVAASENNKAAKVMIPPYEREIYVITMIKKKIIDKCAEASE